MKYIKCSNLTPYYCGFVARGETGEDAKHAMIQHLINDHADVLSVMPLQAKLYLEEEIDEMLAQSE